MGSYPKDASTVESDTMTRSYHIVVIVCGGRDYNDDRKVSSVLDELLATTKYLTIVEGGQTGADRLAQNWAKSKGATGNRVKDLNSPVALETYHANWDWYGKAAGPKRNAKMIEEQQPDLVIAFPGNRGTANMIELAHAAHVKIREIK